MYNWRFLPGLGGFGAVDGGLGVGGSVAVGGCLGVGGLGFALGCVARHGRFVAIDRRSFREGDKGVRLWWDRRNCCRRACLQLAHTAEAFIFEKNDRIIYGDLYLVGSRSE